MVYQAERMRNGQSDQIMEFFPSAGDPGLVVTGFVFRPASDEDLGDAEDEEEKDEGDDFYVFEAHFFAENHPMIGNATTSLLLNFAGCETYEAAAERFLQEVSRNEGYISSKQELFVDDLDG
jgi:hypothetical protein